MTCAATGMLTKSAQPRGTPRRRNAAAHGGARKTSPPVASTDSANPADSASAGSTSSSTITAVASAGTAVRTRPASTASRPTAPITAARNTDGCGPTSSTSPTSVSAPPTTATRGPKPRSASTTNPQRMAKCDPDTASRWVRPVVFASALSFSSMPEVSPTTRPGSRPAGSGARVCADRCKSMRTTPVTRYHHGADFDHGRRRSRTQLHSGHDRELVHGKQSADPQAGADRNRRPLRPGGNDRHRHVAGRCLSGDLRPASTPRRVDTAALGCCRCPVRRCRGRTPTAAAQRSPSR